MERKLIRQGGGGYTVYLPKKWVEGLGMKAGDKVDIDPQQRKLVLSPRQIALAPKRIELDLTGLDRDSILQSFTALYESGFDEVKFTFKKDGSYDNYAEEKTLIPQVLVELLPRFHGFEIIEQTEHSYTIKDISKSSEQDFNVILRRIFFLILDFDKYIQDGLKGRPTMFRQGKERYWGIVRFVSFCLRLLNKRQVPDAEKYNLYEVINSLMNVAMYYRFLTEDLHKHKVSERSIDMITELGKAFKIYYDMYYEPDNAKLADLNRRISALDNRLQKMDIRRREFMIIYRFSTLLDIMEENMKCVLALKMLKEK